MAGVFLSHSRADKKFISRLAVDLAVRGIPVWFDTWEMEAGDRLYDRVFNGIDESTLLIIALSPDSVKSRWVQKELSAALAKEDKLNRKVIIPIKIAACEAPLSIADRIYADFSVGYLRAVETLEIVNLHQMPHIHDVSPDQQILPLAFSRGLILNEYNFKIFIRSWFRAYKRGIA